MKKIGWLLLLVVAIFFSRPLWEEHAAKYVDLTFLEPVDEWIDSIEVMDYLNEAKAYWKEIKEEPATNISSNQQAIPGEGIELDQITIGMKKSDIEKIHGNAKRVSLNEYNLVWHTYHEDYQNFMMVSYDNKNTVNAMFTNQPSESSFLGLNMDSTRDEVLAKLGEPIKKLKKGNIIYILPDAGEYDLYLIDHNYITFFYDLHEDNTITAIQIMKESVEKNQTKTFGKPSEELKTGFEFQLFDLTNSARVLRGLSILTYDEAVSNTARKHSEDMAIHNYFSHENLKGKSPFDRLEEDGLTFSYAGENLAYGQTSSIFAHEGLMNSMGHRKNILNADYRNLGVGTAFNKDATPYYTENFFSK
ncbi:CAP-associated domain-containing protein [Psychrobacillus lasiicapitis]|uniref:Serine protease n=1 Tax=Psychrobacillus lasiicapitis TaxID=1636719 RepID=A0A544TCG4_9BACI|nr:CAP-associated domain-containing protein [Psychrobacillus lasiicapitis]TQR15145.1 serine protease [Psychrobacillus lasiicapitis]GGA44967.1 secretion protein [Psychrobacillus lasiicapitis]